MVQYNNNSILYINRKGKKHPCQLCINQAFSSYDISIIIVDIANYVLVYMNLEIIFLIISSTKLPVICNLYDYIPGHQTCIVISHM